MTLVSMDQWIQKFAIQIFLSKEKHIRIFRFSLIWLVSKQKNYKILYAGKSYKKKLWFQDHLRLNENSLTNVRSLHRFGVTANREGMDDAK